MILLYLAFYLLRRLLNASATALADLRLRGVGEYSWGALTINDCSQSATLECIAQSALGIGYETEHRFSPSAPLNQPSLDTLSYPKNT